MNADSINLYGVAHSDRAKWAITEEAQHWTCAQILEVILAEWACNEELIDIAQTLQVRRHECGMFAEEKTEMGIRSYIKYPPKESYVDYYEADITDEL